MSERNSLPLTIIAERLGRAEMFGDLPQADLMAIAEFCQEETYREGDMVLREGEPAGRLFIVERGKLALEKQIQLGRRSTRRTATIGYITPGRMAGFSSLVLPHTYSTSAVCVEPTRCLVVDGAALRAFLETHPTTGLQVMGRVADMISDRYRRATSTLTYFLSIVSHELRSPLAAIENYLQTMLGGFAGELTPKQKRMMQRSVLRLTDMRSLIGDIVDLARMRPEQIQDDFEWFDPGNVGGESIEDVRLAAAEKDIRIQVEPPPAFKPIVGARRRMRQVFTNLLNNAIRYAPPGSTVHFRARYEPDALIFEVEDQGPGIPPEDLPYIFEDFFRASNVEAGTGMGLGLSIAKKIVDAHHGQILVESTCEDGPRSGTCFTVRIPLNLMTPEMRREQWLAEEPEGSVAPQ